MHILYLIFSIVSIGIVLYLILSYKKETFISSGKTKCFSCEAEMPHVAHGAKCFDCIGTEKSLKYY